MKRIFTSGILFYLLVSLVTGCGGSGSGDSGPNEVIDDAGETDVEVDGNLELLRRSDSTTTDTISTAESGLVVATITNIREPVVVTFETTLGNLPVTTALTDANNQASVELLAGEDLGAGTVTASFNNNTVGTVAFRIVPVNQTSPDPAVPTSIIFVSSTPSIIAISGSGGVEQSLVKFKVVDELGQPVEGETVNFRLINSAGGVRVVDASGVTNSVGEVQTTVNSGFVATTVRIEASLASNPDLTAVSSTLSISTGNPDQNSTSLALSTFNIEGWCCDGVTTEATMRLADHFNNPVPDGTSVQFRTEGGSIIPNCETVNGTCSVTFTSQEPRPRGLSLTQQVCFTGDTATETCAGELNGNGDRTGRVSLLGFATGEESFADLNSNGLFDVGDEVTAFLAGDAVTQRPFDLAEAFVDFNENGSYNPEIQEEFIDFDGDGMWDDVDNLYNGSLCGENNAASCGDPAIPNQVATNVRDRNIVVLSGSSAYFNFTDLAGGTISLAAQSSFSVTISDENGNPLPAGTTIVFEGSDVQLIGVTSYEVGNTREPGSYGVSIREAGDPGGAVTIRVSTPGTVVTILTLTVSA